jgi:hypothetical protein
MEKRTVPFRNPEGTLTVLTVPSNSGYRQVQCNFQISNRPKSTLRKIYRSLRVGKLFE